MKFSVIVADPPWNHDSRRAGDDRHIGDNEATHCGSYKLMPYVTMTAKSIIALDVGSLAADTCMLALWTTSSHLLVALEAAKAWGFTYKTTACWVKMSQRKAAPHYGFGQYVRQSHELVLLCTKGTCRKELASKAERGCWLTTYNKKHSAKPEELQDVLERMYPNKACLELFARRNRPGWVCTGNESPSTMGEDIRKSIERLKAAALVAPPGVVTSLVMP